MRIISKFKDYYDSVRAYGEDRDLVYVREERDPSEEVSQDVYDTLHRLCRRIPDFGWTADQAPLSQEGLIGFCGHLYPVWNFDGWALTEDALLKQLQDTSQDSFNYSSRSRKIREACLSTFYPDREKDKREAAKQARQYYTEIGIHGVLNSRATYESVRACREDQDFRDHTDMFVELGVPVFFFSNRSYHRRVATTFILNPRLEDYGFQSIMDPWTAYQELSMFVGGVLPRSGNNLVEITDDKVIRDAKGHGENSFKMPSPGKKARRRSKG